MSNEQFDASIAQSAAQMKPTAGSPFKPAAGERILLAANVFYGRGEVRAVDLGYRSDRAQEIRLFLTNRQIVLTRVPDFMERLIFNGPLFLIFRLFRVIKGRPIITAISLSDVAVVEAGTRETGHFSLWTLDGQKFSFKPVHAFQQASVWVAELVRQVKQARPEAQIVTQEQMTYFQAGEAGQPRAGTD